MLLRGDDGFDQAATAWNLTVRQPVAEVVPDLKAYISGRKPYTTLSPGGTAAQSFSGETLARLREITRARDPHNVFRANYPVLG